MDEARREEWILAARGIMRMFDAQDRPLVWKQAKSTWLYNASDRDQPIVQSLEYDDVDPGRVEAEGSHAPD